ncbi:PH domain-containing rcdII-like [Mercenaria mercenaria]|uniref:PH domain-containing rcdII-like n=1 Tax=Mercenaria mercenaria TaxID=6596 RepID=UPI00234EB78E|nr:PH domain-containing rcdII-like [Mercenaria mercenaria]
MILEGAKDYVDNIIPSTQPVQSVLFAPSERKRNFSETDIDCLDSDVRSSMASAKKAKSDDDHVSDRVMANARRVLYGNTPGKSVSSERKLSVQSNDQPSVVCIMMKLDDISNDIKKVNHDLSDRIDKLEVELGKRLSEKLSDKICQQVDKRISVEIKRVNKAVDEKFDTVRTDMNSDMEEIQVKLNSITDTVQTLIRDILKLSNIEVVSARRVKNDSSKYPGVVVATLQNSEARDRVLKAKSTLRNNPFKDIYIDADRTREERLATQNLRTVVDAMNKGARMSIRGNKVVLASRNSNSEPSVNSNTDSAFLNNQTSENNPSNSDGGLYSSISNSQNSSNNKSCNNSGNNRYAHGHWGQGRGNRGQGGRGRGRGFQNNNNNRDRRQQQ